MFQSPAGFSNDRTQKLRQEDLTDIARCTTRCLHCRRFEFWQSKVTDHDFWIFFFTVEWHIQRHWVKHDTHTLGEKLTQSADSKCGAWLWYWVAQGHLANTFYKVNWNLALSQLIRGWRGHHNVQPGAVKLVLWRRWMHLLHASSDVGETISLRQAVHNKTSTPLHELSESLLECTAIWKTVPVFACKITS